MAGTIRFLAVPNLGFQMTLSSAHACFASNRTVLYLAKMNTTDFRRRDGGGQMSLSLPDESITYSRLPLTLPKGPNGTVGSFSTFYTPCLT